MPKQKQEKYDQLTLKKLNNACEDKSSKNFQQILKVYWQTKEMH